MKTWTGKIKPNITYTITISGIELSGFTKGESFHGMVEYKKGKDVIIVDEPGQDPLTILFDSFFNITGEEQMLTIIKASPDIIHFVQEELEDHK